MSIFRDFFAVKQKPIFTGSRFGFGSGGGGGGADSGGPVHSASGATIFDIESAGRAVIQFNTPGSITFDTSMSGKDLRIILVGGGGSGSTGNAGGGGAGGMIEVTASTIGAGTYPVSIGNGGTHPGSTSTQGNSGSNSTFGPGLTAYGGGTGGRDTENAIPGGSGGGAGYATQPGGATQPGFSFPGSYTGNGYGNPGGAHGGGYACGGGGGAGGAGGSPSTRVGGAGRTVPAPNFPGVPFSGQLVGGGGGGGDRYGAGASTGGPGGGGEGCSCGDAPDGASQTDPSCTSNANDGTANTGGGGGGSRCGPPGTMAGDGGKGLCIVSYSLT
tara:strand:- start:406 stop:1392 length:987 start_codon:yes stop_codon:yes gene_type:complete